MATPRKNPRRRRTGHRTPDSTPALQHRAPPRRNRLRHPRRRTHRTRRRDPRPPPARASPRTRKPNTISSQQHEKEKMSTPLNWLDKTISKWHISPDAPQSVIPKRAPAPGRAIAHWKVKDHHDVAGRARRYRVVRTRQAISAVLLIAALGLAACGGDDDSTWDEQHQPTAGASGNPDDDGSNDEDSSGSVDEDGFGDYEVTSTSGAKIVLHVTEDSVHDDLIERTEKLREAAGIGPVHWLEAEVTGSGTDEFRVGSCGFTVETQDGDTIGGGCDQGTTLSLEWLSKMDTEKAMDLDLHKVVGDWYDRSDKAYGSDESGTFYVMFEQPIDSVE